MPGQWSKPWRGKVGAQGMMSVHAAVSALMANNTMSSMLRECISYTGDVDTVATIALAAGSCSTEVEQNLPPHLLSGLENDAFGRDYLETLDGRLMARVAMR